MYNICDSDNLNRHYGQLAVHMFVFKICYSQTASICMLLNLREEKDNDLFIRAVTKSS